MLSSDIIDEIRQSVHSFWTEEARKEEFRNMAQGKEIGHRIADYVDEKTTSYLHAHYSVVFEQSKNGKKLARSMGDLWLKENGIYHPVNIKTGTTNVGQPNMVALRKLLKRFLQKQVDSYYLLMIKFLSLDDETVAPNVYFVDMLDYLEYLHFDSGPGQIMLRSKNFFESFNSHEIKSRDFPAKADFLMNMLEEADKKLFINRTGKREELQEMVNQYKRLETFKISPHDQEELNLA